MERNSKKRVAVTNIPGIFQSGMGILLCLSGLGLMGYKFVAGDLGLIDWLYIALGGILLYFAALCIMASKLYFDLENRRYKKETILLFIRYGSWQPLPELEYVSVFYQLHLTGDGNNTGTYNVNLWHAGNKHFTIQEDGSADTAFDMASKIAIQLNIPLLDATEPDDFKWIDPARSSDFL